MSKQSTQLAWDITDWDRDADLNIGNFSYNMHETFIKNGLILPAAIICRKDQERELLRAYDAQQGDLLTGIMTISNRYGVFKLKVLPLERSEITYTRRVR